MKLADNFDDLNSFFYKDPQKLEQGNQKDILTAVTNAMKLSKCFNEIIEDNKKIPENKVTFNDMIIFNKKNNKRIDIINSKLNDEDIAKILCPQSDGIYIPFWVFLIRNMSSINYINYENKNNPFCDDISEEVKLKIKNLIKNKKGEELDNSWINLIMENIPNEVKITNVRLFYLFLIIYLKS